MCVFCAAIPATLAVGARLNAKQNQSQKTTEAQEQPARRPRIPIVPLTMLAVGGLVVSSVIYHTQLGN
jgi:hypothetical protein